MSKALDRLGSVKGETTLQKLVYLVQEYGQYFGYHFKWYNHGPVCPAVLNDINEAKLLGLVNVDYEGSIPVYTSNYQSLDAKNYWKGFKEPLYSKSIEVIEFLRKQKESHANYETFFDLLACVKYSSNSRSPDHNYLSQIYSVDQLQTAQYTLDTLLDLS